MQVTRNVRAVQVPDENPSHPMYTTIYLVGRGQLLTIDSGETMERYRWTIKGYHTASEKAELGRTAVTPHHAEHSASPRWLRNEFGTEVRVLEEGVPYMQGLLPETGVTRLKADDTVEVSGGVKLQVIFTP